ncbi:hypothetical protein [Actinomadura sp. 6N118]|uniref:hypothetical protein n=1 Tax=Actinomadura sp. 6N118 TaxID=3375151 RepID=UPI0037969CE5
MDDPAGLRRALISGKPEIRVPEATVPTRDEARAGGVDRRQVPDAARGRHWGLLLLGWAVQVAVRLWAGSGQTVPVANPDETGYLFTARLLTGGPGVDMSYNTEYRSGYPLLLAPAHWLADEPETVYRIALGTNALINALVFPLVYLLLRRMSVSKRRSYALATATALLPAVVFYSDFVLTDAVLPVLVLGWLLLSHSWLTSAAAPARVAGYGVAAALVVAYAYTCHSRGLILVVVQAGLLAAALIRRWRPWRSIGLAAAALTAGVALGVLLNRSYLAQMYPNGDNRLGDNLVNRLTSLDGWGWTLGTGTGQIWYQSVATGGVAGVGVVVVIAVVLRRDTPARLRALALAVLAIVAGIALATSAALPDEHRIGNYVYSRYLAGVTPVLFAVGAAFLLGATRRAAVAATAAAATSTMLLAAVVQVYAGDRLNTYTFTLFDFPETSFLTWNWTEFRLWRATFAGLTLLGLFLVASQWPRRSLYRTGLVAGLLVAVNVAADTTVTSRISRPLDADTVADARVPGLLPSEERPAVAIDWNVPWSARLLQLHWVWWDEPEIFDSRRQKPPADADLVLLGWKSGTTAASTWPGAPAGWRIAGTRRTGLGDWVAWSRD